MGIVMYIFIFHHLRNVESDYIVCWVTETASLCGAAVIKETSPRGNQLSRSRVQTIVLGQCVDQVVCEVAYKAIYEVDQGYQVYKVQKERVR
jgi:hypothetical protein